MSTDKITIQVWDVFVRTFHWSLVFLFFLAYITEDDWMVVHAYAGYIIGGLISLRLIWGFIGSRYARFSDFYTTPTEVITYLKQLMTGNAKHYIGHNPAGGMMIFILLLSVSLTLFTGIAVYATEGHGPLASSFFANWSEDLLEEVHEFFANFTLLMIFVHLAGVIISSILHGENLIKAMITGKKSVQKPEVLDN